MLDRPDAQVCLRVAAGHQVLRRPFLVLADSRPAWESLLDADHGAVRPVCLGTEAAIPEGHLGRRRVWGAGKLAARALRRLAGVRRDHLALVLNPEHLASGGLAASWAALPVFAAALALYIQDAALFAA